MTTEHAQSNAGALIANSDGKKIQYHPRDSHIWHNCTEMMERDWDFVNYVYRATPEPVSRPWSKHEDVPGPVCWIKRSYAEGCAMITGIDSAGVLLAAGINIKWFTFEQHDSQYEHSTDRKTWLPCTVAEDAT